jgi:hypothetical protein
MIAEQLAEGYTLHPRVIHVATDKPYRIGGGAVAYSSDALTNEFGDIDGFCILPVISAEKLPRKINIAVRSYHRSNLEFCKEYASLDCAQDAGFTTAKILMCLNSKAESHLGFVWTDCNSPAPQEKDFLFYRSKVPKIRQPVGRKIGSLCGKIERLIVPVLAMIKAGHTQRQTTLHFKISQRSVSKIVKMNGGKNADR